MTETETFQIETLFEKASTLPNVPKVVQELLESFNKDRVTIDEIAGKIAADQVLSAKLLRLANSAHYHVSREIGTASDAVAMLGFVTVRTLVISCGLTGSFKPIPGLDLPKFWLHSLKVACVAKHLAQAAKLNRELAFTVGMMHGIGQLLMHMAMREEVQELDKTSTPLEARRYRIERNAFGFDYAEVGASLATHWQFPPALSEAIRRFPEPLAGEGVDPIACVVHLAVWRVRGDEHNLSPEALSDSWPDAVGDALQLDRDEVLRTMPTIKELTDGMEALIG
jgi:HD-like signal output (HDOD) protein